MSARRKVRIAVVGAGAVGLSTAVQIQEALPETEVTLIAEKFNRDTTSDGAAGIFQSAVDLVKGVPKETSRKWFQDSFEFFRSIAFSEEAEEAGISQVSGYQFYIEDPLEDDPINSELYFNYRDCTEREFSIFPEVAGRAHHGNFYTTLTAEGRWLLPWLLKKFEKKGGKIINKKLLSLEELVNKYDVVANCTGLGSNELLGNNEVKPIRGQVIRVKAPWIKHFLMVDGYSLYVIPCKETVIIGGTRQYNDSDLNVRLEDRERIWKMACKHLPSLKTAEWQWEWVGLRPFREPLRLERETLKFKDGQLEVVHNYGHGGNGMALCWGTGKEACRLVVGVVAQKFRNSKL
ncbi:hypothetical protein HELRODRAFT_185481 [Helobdella robusta]|uniref:FAD dependent oxidoreductase domain-containing protein n=1 Tax=Helobdella robusta TaxID=6412 RepID=T1FMV7_HELRO|nr:hypothetical protein HELRODRAFT_185481 [Helobdella robusta]ESO06832.1 hypothetical protein HELRODRAFT_185481 [Helobdella robusta]